MKADVPWRKFRYIEVLRDDDLVSGEGRWPLVDGWCEKAETLQPGSRKGLVGGTGVITLPNGARFSEVSFKTEHKIVEIALPLWAKEAGRKWAKVIGDEFVVSDGSSWKKLNLGMTGFLKGEPGLSSMPWLQKIKDDAEEEIQRSAEPDGTDALR